MQNMIDTIKEKFAKMWETKIINNLKATYV